MGRAHVKAAPRDSVRDVRDVRDVRASALAAAQRRRRGGGVGHRGAELARIMGRVQQLDHLKPGAGEVAGEESGRL
jgi:hypothetical protein